MGVVAMHAQTKHFVGDARRAVGGAELAQDEVGRVASPVDRAFGLAHQRSQRAARIGQVPRRSGLLIALDAREGSVHRCHRGLGDFVAVEAALAGFAHVELEARPDVARVHLGIRLQDRHAPAGRVLLHGPVERRGAAVADDARMHDEATHRAPHRLGDGALQERSDDHVGRPAPHGVVRHSVVDVEFERDLVPPVCEIDPESLSQAVEGMRQQQDAHRRAVSRCAAAVRLLASRRRACRRSWSPSARSSACRRRPRR